MRLPQHQLQRGAKSQLKPAARSLSTIHETRRDSGDHFPIKAEVILTLVPSLPGPPALSEQRVISSIMR